MKHIVAVAIIIAFGFLLLFFSRPNRLAHDQIVHGTFVTRFENPEAFRGDYLFGTDRIMIHSNLFVYDFLHWLTRKLGDQELIYWFAVPFLFIGLSIGMYVLIWRFTRSVFASLGGAFISNVYVPYFFLSVWGLPGPSAVGPKDFYNIFVPPLFLLFFFGIYRRRRAILLATFFITGLLGNVHIISAFNFVLILLTLFFLAEKVSFRTMRRAFFYGIAALIGAAPFLFGHFQYRKINPDPFHVSHDVAEYSMAIGAAAPHVTLEGRWGVLVKALWTDGYLVWPFVAVFLIAIFLRSRRRQSEENVFLDDFSKKFILATVGVNVIISISQVIWFYGGFGKPFFQEPRGMHFLYVVLMLYVGLFLSEMIERGKGLVSLKTVMRAIVFVSISALAAITFIYPVLSARYQRFITPRFSFLTCQDPVYRALNKALAPGDAVLADPSHFHHIRVCTGRAVVVLKRDRGVAYELGDAYLMEWYRRWKEVENAFRNESEMLPAIARKYNARFIASRFCVPIESAHLIYKERDQDLNCIYQMP